MSEEMTILLKIEGKKTDINEFALPEMSLSSARSNMKRFQFQLEVDVCELLNILDSDYKEWVTESKEDDEQCGGPQDELAEAGYPQLDSVLKNNELLELVVGGYLFEDLISKYSEPGRGTKYWWDAVNSCTCDSQKVFINGICYR